ncbi:MAG: CBS domain-containing protein [Rhodospirillales bacterium]|nr:CBS domain-containing protein [Rhodospirillales bacterium]MBO6785500.1 CBS domain-containing protein [Rhodospirillales bacterium]
MHYRKLKEIVADQKLLHVEGTSYVDTVAKLMLERNVAAVLIIDDGKLSGIFTERDLLRRVVAEGRNPADTLIRDVMTSSVVSLNAEQLGFEAVALMIELSIRHVVVTDLDDGSYGIVSIRDFALSELSSFEKEIEFEKQVWSSI